MKKIISRSLKNIVAGSLVVGSFLALSSCEGNNSAEDAVDDAIDGTENAIEEVEEEMDDVVKDVEDVASDIEAKCGEGKCGEGACGGE